MRRYFYETKSDLSPALLFGAMADVARWPEWDGEIESVDLSGPVAEGAELTLTAFGRTKVKLKIETLVEPYRFADIALLPLARMRTAYSFIPAPGHTLVRTEVDFTGPLAGFWGRTLVEDYIDGAARQTRRFLAFAAAERRFGQKKRAARPVLVDARPVPNYVFC